MINDFNESVYNLMEEDLIIFWEGTIQKKEVTK
jgi:hypothetical protein